LTDYELTDFDWGVIVPLLLNTPLGIDRVDGRRAMNGIFWALSTSAPWRALSKEYGPRATCYNGFVRWRVAGVWDRVLSWITEADDSDIQMIDSTVIRGH
jgi:transposase